MTKAKAASTDALSSLHEQLAKVLALQVGEVGTDEDEDGNTTTFFTATPALLTIAARFLKDNSITCEIEDSEGLSRLEEELAKRKKRRNKITSISALMPEDELDEAHG